MKAFVIAIIFTCLQIDSPVGVWVYKEDKSKMEIKNWDGNLRGILISSENPQHEVGTELFRNIEFTDGKWKGEFYLYKKNHWVDVDIKIKGDILFLEYTYGFLTKNIHFYREE